MMMAAAVLSLSLQAQEVKNEREDIKILHGPYLQNVTDTEATLVWISNNESIGWVELAPDDGTHFYQVERPRFFDLRNGIKAESRIHSVKLHGLQPGTTYRYRVFAKDILYHSGNRVHYGNVASTVVYQKEPLRFVTTDPSKDRVTFAMINDIHGKNDLLGNLLGQCDLSDTDMVLFVGDMASVFNSEDRVFADFMDTSVKLFASEVPMYYTRGNHETRGVKAYDFQDYFSTKSEHIYYSYRQGPVFFIALDSGEDKPDSDIEYADMNDSDGYRDEQVEWLRETLERSPYPCVICSHYSFERERRSVPNYQAVRDVINEANHRHPGRVRLVMNGHEHIDNLRVLDNVLYFDFNSANYQYYAKKHDRYPPEYMKAHSQGPHCIAWDAPLSAIITMTAAGRIRIDGSRANWLYGVTPVDAGYTPFEWDGMGRITHPVVQSAVMTFNFQV